ncbi:MAG: hypothetical protein RI897_3464 [Verrucomicrobiota bacterium]
MPDDAPQKPTLLFVDDEPSFLEMVRDVLTSLCEESWTILTAPDANQTHALIQSQNIDLVIVDMNMPGVSGAELVSQLHADYPTIPKIFLAGPVPDEDRINALDNGAILFLEKPDGLAGMKSIHNTLREILKWRAKQGDTPLPTHAPLLELVKLQCAAGNSCIFEVFNPEVQGRIFIQEGSIIHAESPGRRGQSAFTLLATLLDGEYRLKYFTGTPERSILRQWEFLYLEAVQLREQLLQAANETDAKPEQPAPQSTLETQPAPPPTTPTQPAPTLATPLGVSDEEATRTLFRRPSPPSSTPPPATPEPTTQPQTQQPPKPTSTSPRPQHPSPPTQKSPFSSNRTQEILVCSYNAEILYQWQSPQAETRLQLIETTRDRSERISTHLPVGPINRLELQSSTHRTILRFLEDGAVLARSNNGLKPSTSQPTTPTTPPQDWLAHHNQTPGLLAAAILSPQQPVANQSNHPDYPAETLQHAWQSLHELLSSLPNYQLNPWQVRWIFEEAQIYTLIRPDQYTLATLLPKDPALLDTSAIENIFTQFKSLQLP